MSLWFYTLRSESPLLWDGWFVLFDGENTYWSDEMRPSGGYAGLKAKTFMANEGNFYYIGEFD